jgi:hypothetical protein
MHSPLISFCYKIGRKEGRMQFLSSGFAGPWLFLSAALALHVLDEAATGFLAIYNPTVLAVRERRPWFPMPTFTFPVWLAGLLAAVIVSFAITPFAASNARWLRPLAWIVVAIQSSNAVGHFAATVLGHTVAKVRFRRPAPGFYSSPFLVIGSVWLALRLWNTA